MMELDSGKTVKQKRLSEDSTGSENSASTSIESESDHHTDESTSNDTGKEEDETESPQTRWEDPEKQMTYLLSFPEIAGRYTEADPDFAQDDEALEPPIVRDYRPRQYNKGPGNFNRGGDRRNYHQNRQGYQQNYRNNDRQGNYRNDRGGHHQQHYRGGGSGGQGHGHGHDFQNVDQTQQNRGQKRSYGEWNQESPRPNEKYSRFSDQGGERSGGDFD